MMSYISDKRIVGAGAFRRLAMMLLVALSLTAFAFPASAQSTRKERSLITSGNKLYTERKFQDAAAKYREALKENPTSTVGKYNLALSQLRQVVNVADSSAQTKALLDEARRLFADVAALAAEKPGLAAKANYNLGNLEFNVKDFAKAISFYKQALRIDPSDDHARKNLRIAQKQLQNQDNKNQDRNQNQDKDKEKDKDKQDQNKNQNNPQPQQQQPKDNEVSPQSAQRIMQSIDNKENQTRARVNRALKGDKSESGGSHRKKW